MGLGWIALREGHRDRAQTYLQQARAVDPHAQMIPGTRGGAEVKVAVDAQLAVGTATGIGEYVRGLIDALRADGLDVIELSEPKLDPWRFDRRVFWDQVLFRNACAKQRRCGALRVGHGADGPDGAVCRDGA